MYPNAFFPKKKKNKTKCWDTDQIYIVRVDFFDMIFFSLLSTENSYILSLISLKFYCLLWRIWLNCEFNAVSVYFYLRLGLIFSNQWNCDWSQTDEILFDFTMIFVLVWISKHNTTTIFFLSFYVHCYICLGNNNWNCCSWVFSFVTCIRFFCCGSDSVVCILRVQYFLYTPNRMWFMHL